MGPYNMGFPYLKDEQSSFVDQDIVFPNVAFYETGSLSHLTPT